MRRLYFVVLMWAKILTVSACGPIEDPDPIADCEETGGSWECVDTAGGTRCLCVGGDW